MFDFLNHCKGQFFVIGTGRSGTHWIGHTLADHPEIRATIEVDPMFRLSKAMAFDFSTKRKLWPKLEKAYKWQQIKTPHRFYLDKSHTNIWLFEELAAAFSKARFIGMERNPYATVSSMIRHHTVSKRQHRWKEHPLPNPFLGITEDNLPAYPNLSFPARCALRWQSHHERMRYLNRKYPNRLQVIQYEDLMAQPTERLHDLKDFLGLAEPIRRPEIKSESKDKWRKNLTDQDIRDIHEITKHQPPESP